MKRHNDAIGIQQGACNLIAIANVLVSAIQEVRALGKQPEHDEAVRLILHQMAYLANVAQLDSSGVEYDRCMIVCEAGETAEVPE